ncbi:hypothetical protein DFS34DRAFT_604008 [Phlyctochytrium arcticum]|nr:hypothetical protein DFS34DRAFT_604008 [Phlyctochytrium arcticum]
MSRNNFDGKSCRRRTLATCQFVTAMATHPDPYASGTTSPEHSVEDLFDEDDVETAEERIERDNALPTVDYYAVLNVERNATDEDIKNAYRRLCLTFHPDKHHRPDSKVAAERRFEKIQKAYNILSNPTKRHIYDTYGDEAADMSWEVGVRGKTREEIREEYERHSRQRQELLAEQLVNSKGEIQLSLDASQIFDADVRLARRRRRRLPLGHFEPVKAEQSGLKEILQWPEIRQAFVKHAWETQLTAATGLAITGDVMARNGIGAGNVTATIKRVISPTLFTEVSGTLGQNALVQAKVVKSFANESFITLNGVAQSLSAPPNLTVVLGRRITSKTTGYITYRTGQYALGKWGADQDLSDQSACSLGMVRRAEKGQWNMDLQVGLSNSLVSLSYFRILPRSIRGRASIMLSTMMGAQASISGDKKVSKHGRIGLGVDCASMGGVTVRVKLARVGQKFVIPIMLTPQFDLRMAFWAAVVPMVFTFTLDRLYLSPRRKQRLAEKLIEVRAANAERIAQSRLEAEDAVHIMKDLVLRKLEAEESRHGLIVVEALYGKLPESTYAPDHSLSAQSIKSLIEKLGAPHESENIDGAEEKPYIDVTIAIQSLVNNSQLHVSGGHSKSNIIGFYDPCLGEAKRLRITYRFQGKLHQVEVDDQAAVAAPLRAHLVPELDKGL